MDYMSVDSVVNYDIMIRDDGLLSTLKRIAHFVEIQHDGEAQLKAAKRVR